MDLNPSPMKNFLRSVRPYLNFRPHTGIFWLDLVNLLLVAALQIAIAPAIFGTIAYIDLLTPWIVTGMVMQSVATGATLGLVAALILENHSTAPAGLYLCCFWVLCVAINLVRVNFSWRLRLPWLATYVCAMLWVVGFENFVKLVTNGVDDFNLSYGFATVGRFTLAIIIGMILCHKRFPSLTDEEGFR